MIYREYGQTGKKLSLLGFGGMRFGSIDDHDKCVQMMVTAAQGGVNYFDTAPEYFGIKSETVFGKGLAELRRLNLPYYCSTKTFESTEKGIRSQLEAQLKRLNIQAVDFYHIWCITSLEDWQERKKNSVLNTFLKLKEEGLIKHICISSHLIGDEINELLLEGVFEGVLFGYSALDFKAREAAFKAIKEKKLGAVAMNPLGGGVIPQHPERFAFLKRGSEGIVPAALSFLWDHKDITVTLVGFQTDAHVKEALTALSEYKPQSEQELEKMKDASASSLDGVCTGCGYCDNCPEGIRIPQLMDTYNQKLLSTTKKDGVSIMKNRLVYHWDIEPKEAGRCTACGACEKACTQHIKIIERLREISQIAG